MSTTISIELPERTAVQLAQTAHSQQTTIAAVVQSLLNEQQTRLPPEVETEIEALRYLSTELLHMVAKNTLSSAAQERLADLAYQQQTADGLTSAEQTEQSELLTQYDRIMMRRTIAIDLLRQRGEVWQTYLTPV